MRVTKQDLIYGVLWFGFGVIIGIIINLIANSINPLGWAAATGGILSGLGVIVSLYFAWWAINQNKEMHQQNILNEENRIYIQETKSIVSKIENNIEALSYYDQFKRVQFEKTKVLDKFLEDYCETTYVNFDNDCDFFKYSGIKKLFCNYCYLLDRIYSNPQKECLSELVFIEIINNDLLTKVMFIYAIRQRNEKVYSVMLNNINSVKYNFVIYIDFAIAGIFNSILWSERGSCVLGDMTFYLLNTLLEMRPEYRRSYTYGFQGNNNIVKFNEYALKYSPGFILNLISIIENKS